MENTPLYNITVGQYQLITNIDDELPTIEKNIYVVAALHNITYEEARNIKIKEFNSLISSLEGLDIRQLESKKINNNIKLGGKKYWIEHNPNKLTSGQLLDIINIRSQKVGEGVMVMDYIMAALCKPINGKYGDDELTLSERAALCRDVKISEVWNVFVFFWNLWSDYLRSTEDSLQVWMEESIQKAKKILANDGDSLA